VCVGVGVGVGVMYIQSIILNLSHLSDVIILIPTAGDISNGGGKTISIVGGMDEITFAT
jgi:hypothetical protein